MATPSSPSLLTRQVNLFNCQSSFHELLTSKQSTFIIGPLLVSPVKAVVGVVQTVAWVALMILGGLVATFCFLIGSSEEAQELFDTTGYSLFYGAIALTSSFYALSNFFTLGWTGNYVSSHYPNARSF